MGNYLLGHARGDSPSLLLIMQAVFCERQNRLSATSFPEDSTESKVLTRRQDRRGNPFRKRKEEQYNPIREKRSHSTQQLKFVKHQSASQSRQDLPTDNEAVSPTPSPKKSLVFNRFSYQHKEEIREYMGSIKHAIDTHSILPNTNEIFLQIEAYISKMEDNNSKLLEVNYFFQKEFNELMAERQLAKRMERCSKNYCLECRYHLEKENRWKKERAQLEGEIAKLREEISSRVEESSKSVSVLSEAEVGEEEIMLRQSILKMREELQEKDEEYLILLKEFNYLDSINKELKQRLGKTMQEYKYLSIENRTLLNMKTKVIEKQLQCTKYKQERDYFKKKMIDNHRRNEAERCRCKGDNSIFSLSSASNDQRTPSSLIMPDQPPQ